MYHKLLERQLKKLGLDNEKTPDPEQWFELLKKIDRTYSDAEQERYLFERSMQISSEEMRQLNCQLRASETRYALAAQGANDGLWDWDLTSEDIYYSQRWMEILGMNPEPGQTQRKNCWFERIHPEDNQTVVAELDAHLRGETKHFYSVHRVLHTDGGYRWVLARALAVRDETGRAHRIAGSLTDVTEQKLAEEKMAFDAVHDNLTGLPNRKKLTEKLQELIERSRRSGNFNFAVMFIDLDRFKIINDSLGHQTGDEFLLRIARKLETVIRPGDTVARLGGDEFVVVVEKIKHREQTAGIAERILSELKQPVMIGGQQIYSSASIGVVTSSMLYATPYDLIRDADLAMYRAKAKGKARFEFFDSEAHSGTVSMLQLEMDLRRAIEDEEFVLHYQPIVSLDTETVIGFESLIRWNHPARGLVSPADFIPVAEETGLIVNIGYWVLREACRKMSKWRSRYSAAEAMIMSVNLSARQLEQKDLVEQIAEILIETNLPADCLKVEITESVIMSNAEEAIETVRRLRKMGVRVSIDDFGTGYSSLSYLHRFAIDTLKVDRSFINRIDSGSENAEIVQTIIKLAFNLGMDVIAEGIETPQQSDFLKQIGCNYGQGFYYSKPLTEASAIEVIEKLPESGVEISKVPGLEIDHCDKTVH